MGDAEANKQVVLRFLEIFRSYDPATYEPLLAPDSTHRVNNALFQGRTGWNAIARSARLLYPQGHRRRTIQKIIAEGDSVAVIMTIEATTNSGAEYENVYAMLFTLKDGLIADLTEVFDSNAMNGKFDFSVLA